MAVRIRPRGLWQRPWEGITPSQESPGIERSEVTSASDSGDYSEDYHSGGQRSPGYKQYWLYGKGKGGKGSKGGKAGKGWEKPSNPNQHKELKEVKQQIGSMQQTMEALARALVQSKKGKKIKRTVEQPMGPVHRCNHSDQECGLYSCKQAQSSIKRNESAFSSANFRFAMPAHQSQTSHCLS